MQQFIFYVTLYISKIIIILEKILRKNATVFPGTFAEKMCPNFMKIISKPKLIIGVTGTNGKTTVCNMLEDFFTNIGVDFVSNKEGSNISGGITTVFINNTTIFNKSKKSTAVLEIDERSANKVYPNFAPDYLIITNLFRDSIMRNAHSEFIADFLSYYIPKKTKLILNGNDLITSFVAPHNKRVYFGIDKLKDEIEIKNNLVCDMRICPKCGSPIIYDYIRYNHIGFCHCSNCSFKNPKIDYLITNIDYENKKITLLNKSEETYNFNCGNIINAYNILAVIAVLKELKYNFEEINENIKNINVVKSRYDEINYNNYKIITMMAKGMNSVACSRVFNYVKKYPKEKIVVLFLDDQFLKNGSSENISWYYDTDFEFLNDKNIKKIVVAGVRNLDIFNRLVLAGINEDKIIKVDNEYDVVSKINLDENKTIFVLYELYANNIKNDFCKQLLKKIRG